jgi:hypothetical protein
MSTTTHYTTAPSFGITRLGIPVQVMICDGSNLEGFEEACGYPVVDVTMINIDGDETFMAFFRVLPY